MTQSLPTCLTPDIGLPPSAPYAPIALGSSLYLDHSGRFGSDPGTFCLRCPFSLESSFPGAWHACLLLPGASARTASSERPSLSSTHSIAQLHFIFLTEAPSLCLNLPCFFINFQVRLTRLPTPLDKYLHEKTGLAWLVHSSIPRASNRS